ncbi:MAG: NUDIX hydrolase [Solirubrobacteraceae bacterium]
MTQEHVWGGVSHVRSSETAAKRSGGAPRHCWNCGAPLQALPPTQCSSCGQHHYVNPKPCGEAVVVHEEHILLVQRAHAPWRGRWDIPGGFCEGDEHPMHAAERELLEEVGLRARAEVYLGTWMDSYGPAAADGLQEHTANSAYLMRTLDSGPALRQQVDEIAAIQWFPLAGLPADLAFPQHVPRALEVAALVSGQRSFTKLYDRTW